MPTPLPTSTPYGTKVSLPGYDTTYHADGRAMNEQEYDEYLLRQQTPIAPVEPVAPVDDSSSIEQAKVGAVQTIGGISMAAEALTHSDFLHNMNNSIEEWTKEHSPEEFNLKDAVASGLGSSGPLYVAGAGVMSAATFLGMSNPMAAALGITVLTLFESAVEAGHRYRKSLKEHGDEDKASKEAAVTFGANLPLNALMNATLGPLGRTVTPGLKGAAKTVGKGVAEGAISEPAQLLISEGAAGHLPTASELGTEALVGGIVSGIIGTGFSAMDMYKGKKSDFTGDDLDATRNEHKEETSTETPLISADTLAQVTAAAEAEFVKTNKYAAEPEGTMPQLTDIPPTAPQVDGTVITEVITPDAEPVNKYATEPEGAMPQITEKMKAGIRTNLIAGNTDAIGQFKQVDAEEGLRIYRKTVMDAIRENKIAGIAALDTAVSEALGVSPLLEQELGTRIAASPITGMIAKLESTPEEQRTPELQERIDRNKELLANTTLAKQLEEVKKAKEVTTITRKKSLFKEVRIEGDKLVSKEAPVAPTEGVVPAKRGKKVSVQVDVLSPDYIEGLKAELNISELRKTQQLLEDTAADLEGELIDHKKGTPEYDTINNKMQMYKNLADSISKFRGERAGKGGNVTFSFMGGQEIYELLSNPNILFADITENLRIVGSAVYDASMKITDFLVAMKGQLGDLYERFQHHLLTVFEFVKNNQMALIAGSWISVARAGKVNEAVQGQAFRKEILGRAFQDYGDDQYKIWVQDTDASLNPGFMTIYNDILSLNDESGMPSVSAGQLINLNHTFIGYPELKNMLVLTADLDLDTGGYYNPLTQTIYINENVAAHTGWETQEGDKFSLSIQEVLLHELQHAIQYIEGWSLGTSPEAMKKRIVLSLGKQSNSKKANLDKISNNSYWNTIGEALARDMALRQLHNSFREGLGLRVYTDVNPEELTDNEGYDIVATDGMPSPYSAREKQMWLIMKDTDPTVAAERLIHFDIMPLASNDIRKGLVPAQRYEDGTIVTGESQMKIGFHSDRETTELGWVTPHGDFLPERVFAPYEVANMQDKAFTKETVSMSDLIMSAQKVVDPIGQVSTETFNEEKMLQLDKVKVSLIRYEKTANTKGMALDNYLRELGFSESAVSELMNIHNAIARGGLVTGYITKGQIEFLQRITKEKGLNIDEVKAELGIKDIEGKRMRRADANKLINYIQVNKGVKLDAIIDMDVLLDNIENDILTADTMNEIKRTKAFVTQLFLSPDIILFSTPTGKQIYKVMDKAVILMNKGKERIFGTTGFDIDIHNELIKVDTDSSNRIASVLDGKTDYTTIPKEEQVVVDKMRTAYKYMLNELVDKMSTDVNEATLIRQVAPGVKYIKTENKAIMKAKLLAIKDEYKISDRGMKALDLLRREEENYLPHLFDSQEIIKTALLRIAKIKKTDPLSPKIEQLRNTIARLSGGDFVLQDEIPNELYFAHMEERTGAAGYKMDAGLAFHTYVNSWLRKMYLEPAVNVAKDLYVLLPASQKPYAKWFILEVAGRNKRTPGASYVSMAEWIRLIGFNMGSALTNATGVLNTFADAGAHGIDGMQRAMTVQGRQEFYREGLGYETRFKASPVEELHGSIEKLRKISGILFDQVELGNRMHAFHTGKSKGESIGLKGDELNTYAIEFMHKVQFRYGITGMAKGMRGWPGVATQFSSFTVKQWELILGKWRREPEGLKKIVAYLMLSAGANTLLRFIGMDISNAAGIPLSYGDLLEAVTSASEGDWEKATKHWKLSKQGGTGILPREVIMTGPAINLLIQIKDTHSPDWLGRVGYELSPTIANKAIDFYYGLKHGDAKNDEFPIYAYASKDPIRRAAEGPKDLKYTLGLYSLILRTFGPRPTEETEIQRKEFARLLTTQEITSILHKYDKALISGNTDKMTELFNLYPGVIFDRGTGALKRRTIDLKLTREQRSLFKRKQAQRAATLDAE